MKLSKIGKKLTAKTGILQLMDDLGKAMSGEQKMYMLGGGNPAHIPEVEKVWRINIDMILKDGDRYERMLGNYTTPQGDKEFMSAMASFLKSKYGWKVAEKNIALVNGSQTAMFFLFNMIKGKILFPIVPEYIGYADQGLEEHKFTAAKPTIDFLDKHTFKYRINFENIKLDKTVGAICISRPTNPTGNVITDEETTKLAQVAEKNNIPFIIDNAYGAPFPHIIFSEVSPLWSENIIYVMSFSKIGLPGTRTSVVIANEEIVSYLASINAIASLAPCNVGQQLILPLLKDGSIEKISHEYIQSFYEKKSKQAIDHFHKNMDDGIPYYLHKSEGALFLWLWCKDFPITSKELYERLKKRGVLVVPGEYFFPGFEETWKHREECVRITYSQKDEDVKRGLEIIAEEVKKAYKK